jgi:hypothetical protein
LFIFHTAIWFEDLPIVHLFGFVHEFPPMLG